MSEASARFADNAFYILGLRPSVSRQQIEREGVKLLGMLELGMPAARQYATPIAVFERTPERVRLAMSELRDPNKRVLHEVFAVLESTPLPLTDAIASRSALAPWSSALAAFGWER